MNEPFDGDLQGRLERLALAVPLPSTAQLERIVPQRPSGRGWATASGLGAVIVIGVVLVAVASFSGGLPGARNATPSASPSVPVPVAAATDDGTFRLAIRADAGVIGAGEPITVSAAVTYLGPAPSIDIGASSAIVGFGVEEIGGSRRVDPLLSQVCAPATYKRDQSVTYPFDKSGAIVDTDPNVAFVRQYMNIVDDRVDPILRLPAGQWRIFASTDLMEGTCPGAEHRLTASVTVVVGDAASSRVAAASPPAVISTSGPQPSPTAGPSGTAGASPTLPPPDAVLPYPDGCAAYQLSPRRCAYIVDWAKQQASIASDVPVTVQLLGDPKCASSPDPNSCVDMSMGFQFLVRVRLIAADGTSSDESVACGVGGQFSLLCADPPQIEIVTPAQAGYYDAPCKTENGACATALPSPDPEALGDSQALHVSALDIAIDHVGAYTIEVGSAILPKGLLTDATFGLADDAPSDVLLSSGLLMVITDHADGSRLESAYDHGIRPGVETVDVALTFTVESFEPGAFLHVIDLHVR